MRFGRGSGSNSGESGTSIVKAGDPGWQRSRDFYVELRLWMGGFQGSLEAESSAQVSFSRHTLGPRASALQLQQT